MSPSVLVCPAIEEDLPGIGELFWEARLAAVPLMPAPVHPRADVVAHYAGLDLDDGRELWLAEDDDDNGRLLGFLHLRGEWLDDLYVHPSAQGQGIGSALLDMAKSLRPAGFGLWVFETNTPARAFYARHGLLEREHTDGSGNEERAPDVHLEWPGR